MMCHVLCASCTYVFRLNYAPKNPDRWWCEECKPFEIKPMTVEEEKQISGLISKDGEIWWLPPKN